MRKIVIRMITGGVILPLLVLGMGSTPAHAAAPTQLRLVKDAAAAGTPQVLNGKVLSISRVGNTMLLGGQFTTVRNAGDSTSLARTNIVAFDANTGQISTTFNPTLDGLVNVIIPSGDGQTVYVGGAFNNVNGAVGRRLVRMNVNDGSVVSAFNAGPVAGDVKDLRLYGGHLIVAGAFTHIANQQQSYLASVNPTSGAYDPYIHPVVAGTQNGGFTAVIKIDVSASAQRLLGIGNFSTVDGLDRRQAVMLDLGPSTSSVANWETDFYKSTCSASFNSYMRDLDIADDGTFGVISTTGAYKGATTSCDTTARWEMGATGTGIQPSWIDYTGGDTTYAVEVTDGAVYTGGHARWQNNPFAGDKPGQGSVARPGIAALDPVNGLPFSWNPTRDRGVGVFDFRYDADGLWVGSDTEYIGTTYAYRPRLALLPVGGLTYQQANGSALPNDIYSRSASQGLVRTYSNGSTFGTTRDAGDPTHAALTSLKGAFMINGDLYTAWSDRTFVKQAYNGTQLGSEVAVNGQDALVALTDWQNDIASMTGLAYQRGRMYFTLNGSPSLYYRYFNPESRVVGAQRFVASTGVAGLSLSTSKGLFLTPSALYTVDSSGRLLRTDWNDAGAQAGAPVAGTTTAVSGPGVDAKTWSGPVFLFQDADGTAASGPPAAKQSSSCTSLACDFSSAGSTPGSGSITGYQWTFGDGTSSTAANPSHTFAASGTYTVSLTITNSSGETSTDTANVTVTRVNQAPTARFTQTCNQLACQFDGSTSTDSDGNIASYTWEFGDGTPSQTGPTVDHTFPGTGTYPVTLTVTDNEGATNQAVKQVSVSTAAVSQVAATSSNGNRSVHSVTVPGSVQAGDLMVLSFTGNTTATTLTPPAGWTQLRTVANRDTVGVLWSRTATAGDAGSTVTVTSSGLMKSDLALSAYRSTTGTAAVVDSAMAFDTASTTDHTSPTVTATDDKAWLVTYFARENSTVSSWAPVAGQTTRTNNTGAGGGNISAELVDSAGPVQPGTRGGLTGSLSVASGNVVTWSLLVGPA